MSELYRPHDSVETGTYPSPEYQSGEKPLDFNYEFKNGSRLTAIQDEDGIPKITITSSDGQEIFDIAELLPENFRLVTPALIREEGIFSSEDEFEREFDVGRWFADIKKGIVAIGDWTDIKDLFTLLHEIGHIYTHQGVPEEPKPDESNIPKDINWERGSEGFGLSTTDEVWNQYIADWTEWKLQSGTIVSEEERESWFYAFYFSRKIKDATGVDVFHEMFKNVPDSMKYINKCLRSHRQTKWNWDRRDPRFEPHFNSLFDKPERKWIDRDNLAKMNHYLDSVVERKPERYSEQALEWDLKYLNNTSDDGLLEFLNNSNYNYWRQNSGFYVALRIVLEKRDLI